MYKEYIKKLILRVFLKNKCCQYFFTYLCYWCTLYWWQFIELNFRLVLMQKTLICFRSSLLLCSDLAHQSRYGISFGFSYVQKNITMTFLACEYVQCVDGLVSSSWYHPFNLLDPFDIIFFSFSFHFKTKTFKWNLALWKAKFQLFQFHLTFGLIPTQSESEKSKI